MVTARISKLTGVLAMVLLLTASPAFAQTTDEASTADAKPDAKP